MQRSSRSPRYGGWYAVLPVGVLASGVVLALALSRAQGAVSVGVLLAGSIGTFGGLWLLWRGARRPAEGFRRALAAAAVVWGAGQLVLGALLATGSPTYPTPGDVISMLAVPFVLVGALSLPRASPEVLGRSRLLCEAVMVASAGATALWLYWLRDLRVPGGETHLSAADWVAVLGLSLELLVAALMLVVAVRDLDPAVTLTALGVMLYVAGDLSASNLRALDSDLYLHWSGPALSCLAWSMVIAGIARTDAQPAPRPPESASGAEERRGAVTFAACGLPMAAVLVHAVGSTVDLVTVVLVTGVVAGFGGREALRGRQGRLLLDTLAAHANKDALTGLGNRRAAAARLAEMEHSSLPVAVLSLDIDRFKDVNSQLGHPVGDDVLVSVSEELQKACRPASGRVYRLGGDEFAVLVRGDIVHAERLAHLLRDAVRTGAGRVPGLGLFDLTGSVGVAPVTRGHASTGDPLEALTQSSHALRAAKQERAGVRVYTRELAEEVRAAAVMERRLRLAVARDAIGVHFQPIVELATGRVCGLEALSRWHDDQIGHVAPDVFISLAEQSGLIMDIGRHAMSQALQMASALAAEGHRLDIGVNVSPVQLRAPSFVDEVAAMLTRYGVPAPRLVLEVTEGIFMDPADPAVQTLQQLAALGVQVSIDDFGSGYSSFGYMTRLPAGTIKVDRSLTMRLDDARNHTVVRSIVAMTSALGLDVVVEGVETQEAADALQQMGAGYAQGWLYAKAVPPADVPDLLKRLGTASVRAPAHR